MKLRMDKRGIEWDAMVVWILLLLVLIALLIIIALSRGTLDEIVQKIADIFRFGTT